MKEIFQMIKELPAQPYQYVFTTFLTFLTWVFGGWDMPVLVLLGCIGLDYLSGVLVAWNKKELSSEIGRKGLTKKFMIILVLIFAVLLDRLIGNGTWVFRTLVCYFYVANEAISLLENASNLGLPVPEKLKDALVQLKDGNKKDIMNKEE